MLKSRQGEPKGFTVGEPKFLDVVTKNVFLRRRNQRGILENNALTAASILNQTIYGINVFFKYFLKTLKRFLNILFLMNEK